MSETVQLTTVAMAVGTPGGVPGTVDVQGEPTASPHLFITPHRDHDGRYTGAFTLTHAPTGLMLTSGRPGSLADTAAKVAHLDWSWSDQADMPTATKAGALQAIREATWHEPSAVELPAHDAWGKDGKWKGLPRAAVPSAQSLLESYQHARARIWGDGPDKIPFDIPDPTAERGTRPNPEWTHWIIRQVHDFGLAYLLLALHRVDPAAADSASAWLTDQWEGGDTIGEWAWSWHQDLVKGEHLTLPGVPDLGPLLATS